MEQSPETRQVRREDQSQSPLTETSNAQKTDDSTERTNRYHSRNARRQEETPDSQNKIGGYDKQDARGTGRTRRRLHTPEKMRTNTTNCSSQHSVKMDVTRRGSPVQIDVSSNKCNEPSVDRNVRARKGPSSPVKSSVTTRSRAQIIQPSRVNTRSSQQSGDATTQKIPEKGQGRLHWWLTGELPGPRQDYCVVIRSIDKRCATIEITSKSCNCFLFAGEVQGREHDTREH